MTRRTPQDPLAAAELGAQFDLKPLPTPKPIPWAPGDLPHAENLDLREYPVALLKLKVCRSFRADLRHKLTLIVRAHGGNGHGGVNRAAARLKVSRIGLYYWLIGQCYPGDRLTMERIDHAYEEAIEILVAAQKKRWKRQVKRRLTKRALERTILGSLGVA